MTPMALVYILSLAVVLVGALATYAAVVARRQRVVCPDTGRLVAVACDPREAVATVFTGGHLRVTNCERWPDKLDCDRACEKQLRR